MTKQEQEYYSALEANTLEQNLELQKQVVAELADLGNQLRAKKYAVDLDSKTLNLLIEFLANNVKFKGGESLGLVQLDEELHKVKVQNGVLLIESTIVQAVYFFLSRHEDSTLVAAKQHQTVFKPFTKAYEHIVSDGNAYKKVGERVTATEQQVAFQEDTLAAANQALHGREALLMEENDAASTVE